ncbi:metal-dependent hydrolase [Gluconobacter wancherniae]|uniref:metal-dependent hydrolase n=1 Tax=Gluconobacter wancherniae TaxID=1307955 RepID=UPI00309DD818
MTGRSHLLIGGFTVLCAMRWHFLTPEPFSVVAALFGSVLPDIDTERSIVGARCKPLSRLIARTFGHRGMTHSGVLLSCRVRRQRLPAKPRLKPFSCRFIVRSVADGSLRKRPFRTIRARDWTLAPSYWRFYSALRDAMALSDA